MNPDELRITLNIAQLVLLGGLIWGLARMSKAVDVLGTVTNKLAEGLSEVGQTLNDLAGRVMVLEDRGGRRATDAR